MPVLKRSVNSRVSIHSGISCGDEIRKNEVEILADFRALRDDIDSWLTEMFPDSPNRWGGTGAGCGPGTSSAGDRDYHGNGDVNRRTYHRSPVLR